MSERRVPADLEAEEALLGTMLMGVDGIRAARDRGLRARDFYVEGHRRIFAAIMGLFESGKPVDVTLVAADLRATANGGALPGRESLLKIQSLTPASANARAYASAVAEKAVLRHLIQRTDDVQEVLWDPTGPVPEKVAAVQDLVRDADLPVFGGAPSPTLDDFVAAARDVPFLIPQTLRRRERLLIVAEPGIGKTTLSRQWGIQLSLGQHPWELYRVTDRLNVLIVDCENDPDGAGEELADLVERAKRGGMWEPERVRIESRTEGIDVLSRRDFLWLCERVAANKPDVLVIGPLYKLHNVDDNDGAAAKRVVEALDEVRKRFDVALLLETHAPKECWSIRGDKAAPLHIKGSSVWTQWPEFVFGLDPDSNGKTVLWHKVRPPRYKRRLWPGRLKRDGRTWPWEDTKDRAAEAEEF